MNTKRKIYFNKLPKGAKALNFSSNCSFDHPRVLVPHEDGGYQLTHLQRCRLGIVTTFVGDFKSSEVYAFTEE